MSLPEGQRGIQAQKGPLRPGPARHQPETHRPWSRAQVREADSWPTKRGQPVSVALSPTADRLALSVGQGLSILPILDRRSCGAPLYHLACALAPGLAWSPAGDKLAFRDDDGPCRLLDLSGEVRVVDGQVETEVLGVTSAMAFSPEVDRLAALAPSLPGRMTLTL